MKKRRKGVKYLVAVESPNKARTLSKFLSKDYKVLASMGHVRDLPKSSLGFDPNDNFKPKYMVTPDKQKIVRELKSYIDEDTIIILAADDDREGEAIAWHLIPTLGIEKNVKKRVVFHEITKTAILHAMDNPRELDINLVNAQQARRILDRAVGFTLSPLLWKKIKYGLSAGRVQSVAVRIIVDREDEIEAFEPDEFWKHLLKVNYNNNPFTALLNKINGKVTKVKNEADAKVIKDDCVNNEYKLIDVESKDSKRNPTAPFITSTLQQEASRKLGFGLKQTMSLAQRLYDGSISVPGHSGGLITYMRTDATNLSIEATTAAKRVITELYGSEYTIPYVRKYKTKAKGAQEAHEAIRPTNIMLKPSDVENYLDPREYKLYSLIWKRTVATQMAEAKVALTTYRISAGTNGKYEFVSKGTKILFPGFMRVYVEGNDDNVSMGNDEKILPIVNVGTVFNNTDLEMEQNFTKPPARYTEASLVKKLETEGIGRPSTFASTITTIMTRGYVEKNEEKRLFPTVIGKVVTKYLKENFSNIVDLKFTAKMESDFDEIAEGKIQWQTVLHNFYDDFVKVVDSKADTERVNYSEARVLGVDKETGKDIIVKTGMYGSYISIGEPDKEAGYKPKASPLPKGIDVKTITLEDAKHYMKIPRVLGQDKNGDDVKVNIGKFGPFVQVKNKYYTLKKDSGLDPYTITIDEALPLIETTDKEKAKNLWWTGKIETHGDVSIINGRYGGYILRHGTNTKLKKANFKLPKDIMETAVKKFTEEDIIKIIDSQKDRKPGRRFKKRK